MTNQKIYKTNKLLRLKQVIAPKGPVPVSRSTWYKWVRIGKAPKPVKLGLRISAWRDEDINDFISNSNHNGDVK